MITIRRVYDPKQSDEHYQILVDKLWPRGISKEKSSWDEWMKEVAPSDELRKWFNHDPAKWEEFKQKYRQELLQKEDYLERIKQLERKYGTLALLYAAKDEEHNNARALKEFLKKK